MKFAAAALLAVVSTASAAINISSIVGTWSSGSGQVLTGPSGIATNPINGSFSYPGVGGYSFSFTEDGYYEQAQITWSANGTRPDCIEATLLWSHGTWAFSANRSEITTSSDIFSGDGRVQESKIVCVLSSSFGLAADENNLGAGPERVQQAHL